jgi:hypothetical protein
MRSVVPLAVMLALAATASAASKQPARPQLVAFARNHGISQLVTVGAAGAPRQRIATGAESTSIIGDAWSPGGRKITFSFVSNQGRGLCRLVGRGRRTAAHLAPRAARRGADLVSGRPVDRVLTAGRVRPLRLLRCPPDRNGVASRLAVHQHHRSHQRELGARFEAAAVFSRRRRPRPACDRSNWSRTTEGEDRRLRGLGDGVA